MLAYWYEDCREARNTNGCFFFLDFYLQHENMWKSLIIILNTSDSHHKPFNNPEHYVLVPMPEVI